MHIAVAGSVRNLRQSVVEPVGSPRFADYQRIANRIRTVLNDGGTILVTGATPKAPTSTLAANIAAALARFTGSVQMMMIDSDAPQFADLPDTVQVLRGGSANPSADIDGAMSDRDRYLVIAALDPVSSADAQTVAAASDAVLIVVNARTKVRDGRAAIEQLDAVGAPVLGAVLILRRQSAPAEKRVTEPSVEPAQADEATTGDTHSIETEGVEADKVNGAVVLTQIHPDGAPTTSTSSKADTVSPHGSASARPQPKKPVD
jgi:hypothetical protein